MATVRGTSRSLTRLAENWQCVMLVAMTYLGIREEDLFRELTGETAPSDRGERGPALRYGRTFEAHLMANGALELLNAIAGIFGHGPSSSTVTNLLIEEPGNRPGFRVRRLEAVRHALVQTACGKAAIDVLIQAPLELELSPGRRMEIVADALVLNRDRGVYLPLEAKSFPAADGVTAPADRRGLRLQAAAQLLALRQEYERLQIGLTPDSRALLVVGSPFGLKPSPAYLEDLSREIAATARAVDAYKEVAQAVGPSEGADRRAQSLTQLPFHFQERCFTHCGLANYCRKRAGLAGHVGDPVSQAGLDRVSPSRLLQLLEGDLPGDEAESHLVAALREASSVYQWGWL